MKTRFLTTILTLAMILALSGCGTPITFKLLFTSSMNGHLDGCTCNQVPKGGTVKMAYFVKKYKKAHPKSLLLCAGDMFSSYVPRSASFTAAEPASFPKEEYIVQSYIDMGYDAVVLGDQDLSRGAGFFLNNAKRLPYVNANAKVHLLDEEQPRAFGVPVMMKEVGGVSIAIIGATASDVFDDYRKASNRRTNAARVMRIAPVVESVAPVAEKAKADGAKVVILLSHAGYDADKALLSALPAVDIIIGGHDNRLPLQELAGEDVPDEGEAGVTRYSVPPVLKREMIVMDDGRFVFQSGQNGRWVGTAAFHVDEEGLTLVDVRYHVVRYGMKIPKETFKQGQCKTVRKDEYYYYCEGDPDDPKVRAWLEELE